MGICPTSPHMLCRLGEAILPCPSWHPLGGALAVWAQGPRARGPLLRAVQSLHDQRRSLIHIDSSKSQLSPGLLCRQLATAKSRLFLNKTPDHQHVSPVLNI